MTAGVQTIIESLPQLLEGTLVTIEVVVLSLIFGIVLGLLGGLARISRFRILRRIAGIYVSVIRGTPFIVQLFFVYYGFPQLGIQIPSMVAAVGCLAVYSGSYQTEIVRGAIQSIDKGQVEAARSLGLSAYQAMRYVVLPQAFLRMLPPLGNEFVALTKNSALVSLVTVNELLLRAQMIISSTFQDVAVFLTVGIIYYILTSIVGSATHLIERKLSVYV
ncbi:MAG: amino acid ABC transporter permease [Alicyclobacillus macrosporangiidus]|uniref:amino acid ABC transporter permease n=1 Tax=Alicyclobacillus macrosporangiidus TaxID=392015 RepID=UPI0026EC4288|nr:amino acid ABC transporter permease [Alicyclobacillus macrosporangiidus]MCL6600716.1 amino acid ABC transporter permease [Alicyclobacillus macrosporangiidus]